MKKHNLTAALTALSVALILGVVSGCASPAPVRRVSPGPSPARSASRPALSRTGNRYALVIGNATYRNIDKLENTVNDAEDIAKALEELGFDVDLRLNVTEAQFGAAIDAYITKLAGDSDSANANEGFFWYAGHGIQIRDQNYLLPVDVNIESERSLQRDAFSLDELLSDLEGARNKVNVVILDACRDNPLPSSSRGAGSRGLAAIQDVPGDLFVMFSTAAGEKAEDGKGKRNSPFAEAFLKHIASNEAVAMMASDVINETMQLTNYQQRPFSRGSIISDKYYSLNPDRSGGGGAGSGTNGGGDQALVFYKEGVSLYANGETDRAILYFSEAIRLNMETPDVYNYRGSAYGNKGEYDRAIANYNEAIRLDPGYVFVYNNRGAMYYNKGDYDRALADYTQAIRLDPNYVRAYNDRGNVYKRKGDYDRALADYTQAIRLDPNYAMAYSNRGITYDEKGDHDRAIGDYTQAIRLDPNYVQAYNNRGVNYYEKGEYDRAIADYTQAIRIDPNHELAKKNLEIARRRGR